jgi:hypothetical protein
MKLKNSEMSLPSNKRFGFFFTFVFLLTASYFFLSESIIIAYIFFALSVVFFLITFVNADALTSLNKLWMRLGYLLGKIISPIVLLIIFFVFFTPYSLVLRLFRRDELQLKLLKRESYWKQRIQASYQTNFRKQF